MEQQWMKYTWKSQSVKYMNVWMLGRWNMLVLKFPFLSLLLFMYIIESDLIWLLLWHLRQPSTWEFSCVCLLSIFEHVCSPSSCREQKWLQEKPTVVWTCGRIPSVSFLSCPKSNSILHSQSSLPRVIFFRVESNHMFLLWVTHRRVDHLPEGDSHQNFLAQRPR